MSEELLRLEALSKYYTGGKSVVVGLSGLTVTLSRGEFVAVTGESGSGKSTLAHVLGGLLPYEDGELYFRGAPTSHYDGADLERYRANNVSFISQNYGILPGCTVLENVVSALRVWGMERDEALQTAQDILRRVELWQLRRRRAAHLSSGQKQRLAIARALAKPAPVLIADEPTGNLDPENSAKVIRLLAEAARERLVILITHEFSQVEALATRHIAIQDGRVALDTVLRPTPASLEETPPSKEVRKPLGGCIAGLQLKSRPVWTALVLLFFALTSFCVFVFAGTFVVRLDDTDTRIYDSSVFPNGDRERIVIVREDRAPLTAADHRAIVSVEHAVSLEPWGYVTDVRYAYREGVDYTGKYGIANTGSDRDPSLAIRESVTIRDSAPFVQTVPILADGEAFLTQGRLPRDLYEAVATDPSLLGTTVTVYIQDPTHWSASAMLYLRVEVTGITDFGQGLYFHEDLGRGFYDYMADKEHQMLVLYSRELADDMLRPSRSQFTSYSRWDNWQVDLRAGEEVLSLKLICPENGNEAQGLAATHPFSLNSYFEVSYNTFDALTLSGPCDQVSLTVSDYAHTDTVLRQLQKMGYTAVSPFRESSTKVNTRLAQERLQTLGFCAAALAAVLVLQVLALRGLFSAQLESYGLLSGMGLRWKDARASVFAQLVSLGLLGQLLGAGLLGLCALLQVEQLRSVLRYLPWYWLPVLWAVHMSAVLLSAGWAAAALRRQVYPLTGRTADLPDEEVAA